MPRPDDATLRRTLTAMQYQVTQADATEPPFRNAFWDHHEAGDYVCIVSGDLLFRSEDKFDSGTGWPSFTQPIRAEAVTMKADGSGGRQRVEVRSAEGDSHLGHVFRDGPAPTGMRYCINSASLRFVPRAGAATADLAAFAATSCAISAPAVGCATTLETAILAGGCFWGMEELLRAVPGVLETEVGYTGGALANPDYTAVRTGRTGHAEALRVTFDPAVLPFTELLRSWFFLMHDPTTTNRQGNDIGTQYRSAIFFTTDEQRSTAESVKAQVGASGQWHAPIVTEIVAAGDFTRAEDYHQRYLEENPGGYTCHFMRRPKPAGGRG